jgi:hypothetical protein
MQLNLKNTSYSLCAFIIICISALVSFNFFVNWGMEHHPFKNDINQYYSYLNALFIEHDLSFKSNSNNYWLIETPIHRVVPKVTYGMALFYAPFYLIAKLFSAPSSTGYEPIYAQLVHFGCIMYSLIGIWFTRKTLLLWFNELVTAIVVVLLFFGTNLFYYTVSESESVHGILFFLIAVFLYQVIKWHQTDYKMHFLLLSVLAGFICLIRPTEALILLLPLLIGINLKQGLQTKFNNFFNLKSAFFVGLLFFILPLLPQLIYWKIQSGSYLFFSYGNSEGFFWTDPQIMNVFFGFRKGLFIYTPMMFFSILGFIMLYKKNKELFYPILLYFLINAYLVCAWWDWSFGGSFGMRAFIHCFAILVVPFAYFVDWVLSLYKVSSIKTSIVFITAVLCLFFCGLNVFQSNLYKHQIIHYDGMNKKAYQFIFLKKKYSQQDLDYLVTLFKSPDYEARRKGYRDE